MADVVTAFAPASIGNLAVGFDMLGLALDGIGDRVRAQRSGAAGVSIAEVQTTEGETHPFLSTEATQNTASIAAQALWDEHGDGGGVQLTLQKGIPLQSGMGSSAASAVAAVVATNALLAAPLPLMQLLAFALEGERFASGGLHADNVAPSLLGGLVLCPSKLLPRTVKLPAPTDVSAVVLHPELQVNTAEARRGLKQSYSMEQWLEQQGYLAGFVAGCMSDDVELIHATLKDVMIEPQRAGAVPCFADVREAAMNAAALGCSLSGSGPSIFALARSAHAPALAVVMEQACRGQGIGCRSWISTMNAPGAHVEA